MIALNFTVLLTSSGIVLRPAFIYGKRRVDGFELPLDLVGEPAEKILRAVENFTKPLSSLPASDLLLAPPVSVDDVALAVINGVRDDDFFGIFTIDQIKEAANKVRVWSTYMWEVNRDKAAITKFVQGVTTLRSFSSLR